MARINQLLIRHSDVFFGYDKPTDFRLEDRHPELFPTNVGPKRWQRTPRSSTSLRTGRHRRRSFCALLRQNAPPIPKTIW